MTTGDQFKHFLFFFTLIWPTFEPKPDLFECFNLHFLILHLKNWIYQFWYLQVFNVSNYRQKHIAVGIAQLMLWNPLNWLNSIEHISKTILNWLKRLGKLHTHMSCYTCTTNQPIWSYWVNLFFFWWFNMEWPKSLLKSVKLCSNPKNTKFADSLW